MGLGAGPKKSGHGINRRGRFLCDFVYSQHAECVSLLRSCFSPDQLPRATYLLSQSSSASDLDCWQLPTLIS